MILFVSLHYLCRVSLRTQCSCREREIRIRELSNMFDPHIFYFQGWMPLCTDFPKTQIYFSQSSIRTSIRSILPLLAFESFLKGFRITSHPILFPTLWVSLWLKTLAIPSLAIPLCLVMLCLTLFWDKPMMWYCKSDFDIQSSLVTRHNIFLCLEHFALMTDVRFGLPFVICQSMVGMHCCTNSKLQLIHPVYITWTLGHLGTSFLYFSPLPSLWDHIGLKSKKRYPLSSKR